MPKILIADDEPSLRLLVKATLSANKSFDIIEAVDGHEALSKSQSELPDLLLLDVMMPGLSGFEVCERLKNDPKTKKIVIIMLTAKGQQSDRDWAISVGTDYFLTKPFSPIELFNLIEKILSANNKEAKTTKSD
ncbi:MAG: response regulator [Candidatus Melainabacteria bacterium]|nr:response regulator [Candidatus Melainabacteria bacterium]